MHVIWSLDAISEHLFSKSSLGENIPSPPPPLAWHVSRTQLSIT